MAEENQSQAQDDIPNPSEITTPTTPEEDKSISEKKSGSEQGEYTKTIQEEPQKLVCNVTGVDYNNKWTLANKISMIGIIAATAVNGFLAVFTYRLFNEASKQSHAAIQSANAAKSAVAEYAKANNLTEQSIKSNNTSAQRVIDVSEKSLNTQIDAFKRAQEQFAIENSPYLQCSNGKFDSLSPGSRITFSWSLSNFGKQPVIIMGIRAKMELSHLRDFNDFNNMPQFANMNGLFIPSNNGIPLIIRFPAPLINSQFEEIRNSSLLIYLIGEIKYLTPVTKKKRIYTFISEIIPYPFFGVRTITNKDDEYHGK